MKIQQYINDKDKYKVDLTYQRPNNVWSDKDKKCLIDTILREEPMPMFFLNWETNTDLYYIVDGQQRLSCIRDFYDNKVKLSKAFSNDELDGCTFNGEKPLSKELKEKFLNYDLKCHIMENYDDEKVRVIFSRLQRGKPLNLGERLNAKPGNVVNVMRELANHNFITYSIGIPKERYGIYPDVTRMLFYETYGVKDCGSEQLYNFFDEYKNLDKTCKQYKKVISVLNYLEKCFPRNPGNYAFLSKHGWVIAVYMFISELSINYSLINKENDVQEFVKNFHNKVYNEDFRNSHVDYQRFYDNIRGGWSEKNMLLRKNILIKYFLEKYDIKELDVRRQISEEEKISVFSKNSICEICRYQFKDYKEPEYHHEIRYIDGGKTSIDNIAALCKKCHDNIHMNDKIKIENVNNDDYEEIE